jgi:hypothetical protein
MGAVLVAGLPRRIQPKVVSVTGAGRRNGLVARFVVYTSVERLCSTMV